MKKTIKVSKKIKPKHIKNRLSFDMIVGEKYYVSFGGNKVQSCILINEDKDRITIQTKTDTHILLKDEIGRTPEEAVINTVSD